MNKTDKIYRAAIYVRLSKEDGDSFSFGKSESDSITNQKLLIQKYLDKMPDIEVVKTFEDDGFTGTNFQRPAFEKMLSEIEKGTIDCVAVKDLSRLGREYIGAGNLIERVFPAKGIRFIAVNDDYDSLRPRGQSEHLIVPVKNLMNEQYSRDISGKVRSALDVKRQQGKFIGSFAPYGYMKDKKDRNQLIVDEYAAGIVLEIFKLKLEGFSMEGIAKQLTARKVLTPADYKKNQGENYKTTFKLNATSAWSAVAIKRILVNEVYIGNLVQGKHRKVSYKVNKVDSVEEDAWERVENTHEPIVDAFLFNEVQKLLKEDTHVNKHGEVYPLAGKVFCADCGAPMVRKIVPSGNKKFPYYVCSNNKTNSKWCTSHSIRDTKLEQSVLVSVQAHIAMIMDMDKAMNRISHLQWEKREVKNLTAQIEALQVAIEKDQNLRLDMYADLKSGIINRSEYESFRQTFKDRIEKNKQAQKLLRDKQNSLVLGQNSQQGFLQNFRKYANVTELNRKMINQIIERISVLDSNHVDVEFKYTDQILSKQKYMLKERQKMTILDGQEDNNGSGK